MHTDLEEMDVPFLIRLIYDAIGRISNQELKPMDLTYSQTMVLAYLRLRKGSPASITEIQEFMDISHPTALGLVRRLEKKGFVHVLMDPNDKRVRLIVLDAEKEKLFAKGEQQRFVIEKKLLTGLSEREQKEFKSLLIRVHQNIIQ